MRFLISIALLSALIQSIRYFFRIIDGDDKNTGSLYGGGLSGCPDGAEDVG